MEKSKRLETNIVVRRKLTDGKWIITIAKTQDDWWSKAKNIINGIIN